VPEPTRPLPPVQGGIAPTRAFLVVTLAILVAELCSINYGPWLGPQGGWFHESIDTLVILALTLPALSWFFARPLTAALRAKAQADLAMQRMCHDLDLTVRERTAQLESLNQSLRQSEANYASLLEASPTGVFILHGNRIVFGNHRFSEMTGRSLEALGRIAPASLVHPEDLPALVHIWNRRATGQSRWDCEFRVLAAGGALRWVSGRFAPIRFQEDTALLGNVQDITEHHQAEQEVRESREALRGLSELRFTILEEDRRRVARELHDGIGQTLSAIKFLVERTMNTQTLPTGGDPLDQLRGVIPLIQRSVDEIRRICMALRPSTLDDLGLLATLKWFTREFQATYPGIGLELAIAAEEALIPEALKTSIFRITQESLNNVAKHAQARKVAVGFQSSEGGLVLVIQDDGVGFDPLLPRDPGRPGGLGFASMRERAEYFGGSLAISSAPGCGTTIRASWPEPVRA